MRLSTAMIGALPLVLLLAGCSGRDPKGGTPAAAPSPAAATQSEPASAEAIELSPAEIEHLDLKLAAVTAADYRDLIEGYAQVWSHESIAQLAAEVSAAEAAARQSGAAVQRIESLADTPGAYSADALASAQRQAAADAAALLLARRKLSALLGDRAPLGDAGMRLADIASGRLKLVRVTFPVGSGLREAPGALRLFALGSAPDDKGWSSRAVWNAPADSSMPGRSVWVLAAGGDALAEGERLIARAPYGPPQAGALVPDSAVVVSNDQLWCFVERPAGTFRRVAIDTRRPAAEGYVVIRGVAVGDRVVIQGAGLLLARAMGAGADAEE